jgi:tRNA nucleotidyltransferase (CCA-adding enzyme)
MRTYLVGGAVRDRLLGRPDTDRDWVVVGATPGEMAAAGFIPVGRDFPVFLHPQTKEEYALARTERKTAPGYRGFAFHADPNVTLEEDLARRDLTINAMAIDSGGNLVDPCGGQRDLQARVLRHVSPAFAEDPVRILRLARFAARLDDFTVAPKTLALARKMVDAGEVDALVAERVWQEFARGLLEARPSRMLVLLHECGALARLIPELDWVLRAEDEGGGAESGERLLRTLDQAAMLRADLSVRFACLVQSVERASADHPVRELQQAVEPLSMLESISHRLRVPFECRDLSAIVLRESRSVHRSQDLGADAIHDLLERCDAFRRPRRFSDVLLACECEARGGVDANQSPYRQSEYLAAALDAALSVDTAVIAAQALARGATGPAIGAAIREARTLAVARCLAVRDQSGAAADGLADRA